MQYKISTLSYNKRGSSPGAISARVIYVMFKYYSQYSISRYLRLKRKFTAGKLLTDLRGSHLDLCIHDIGWQTGNQVDNRCAAGKRLLSPSSAKPS